MQQLLSTTVAAYWAQPPWAGLVGWENLCAGGPSPTRCSGTLLLPHCGNCWNKAEGGQSVLGVPFFLKLFIYFNWRIITLQNCDAFCHTSAWIGQRHTCVPSLLKPPLYPPYPSRLSQNTGFGFPVSQVFPFKPEHGAPGVLSRGEEEDSGTGLLCWVVQWSQVEYWRRQATLLQRGVHLACQPLPPTSSPFPLTYHTAVPQCLAQLFQFSCDPSAPGHLHKLERSPALCKAGSFPDVVWKFSL